MGIPRAASATCSSAAICPNRSTGITAFVFEVIAALDLRRVDVERHRIDVDEHRLGAGVVDRARRREEGERGRDHFVPAPDIEGPEGQQERVGPVGASDRVFDMRQRGHRSLEARHGLAEDEGLRVDDAQERTDHVILDGGVLRAKIEQWDRHRVCSAAECQILDRRGNGISRPAFADS